MAEHYYGQSASLFCYLSIISQALRAAIVAAELPLRGKLRAEATTVFIDQRILEVIKKTANNMQLAMAGLCVGWEVHKAGWKACCWKVCWKLAMVGLCVGWKVYKAGWEVCCWKVCWWQLAMAGLCVGLSGSLSWVSWHMCSVVKHVPHCHNSHTISMFLHHDARSLG